MFWLLNFAKKYATKGGTVTDTLKAAIREFTIMNGRMPSSGEMNKMEGIIKGAQSNVIQFPIPKRKSSLAPKTTLKDPIDQRWVDQEEWKAKKRAENKAAIKGLEEKFGKPEDRAYGGRIGFKVGGIIDLLNLIRGQFGKKAITTADKLKRPEKALLSDEFKAFNERNRKLTKDELDDLYEEFDEAVPYPMETVADKNKFLKSVKDEEAYMLQQYKMGKLDPPAGSITRARLDVLRKRAEDAELTKDFRLFGPDERAELDYLEDYFRKDYLDNLATQTGRPMTDKQIKELKDLTEKYIDIEKGYFKGGLAGQLHLNQGGRVGFQTGGDVDQEGVIPGFTKLKNPDGFPGNYNEFMYRGPDGQIYGAETYSSIAAGRYPDIYDPNKASTPVAEDKSLLEKWGEHAQTSQAMKGKTGLGTIPEYGMQTGYDFQKKFAGTDPRLSSYLAALWQLPQETIRGVGKTAYNLGSNLATGDATLKGTWQDWEKNLTDAWKTASTQTGQNIEGIMAAAPGGSGLTAEQQANRNKYLSSLGQKVETLQAKGIDPRMAGTYEQNIQLMADPRMRQASGGRVAFSDGMNLQEQIKKLLQKGLGTIAVSKQLGVNIEEVERIADFIKYGGARVPIDQVLERRAKGGRIGFDNGGMSRRGFLKLMGGLAALPIVGKYFKLAKPAATAMKAVETSNAAGMPTWFPSLVNKVLKEGEDIGGTVERQIVKQVELPKSKTKVTVEHDLNTGDTIVDVGRDKHGWSDGWYGQPVRLHLKKGEWVEPDMDLVTGKLKKQKPVKKRDEFDVEEAEFTGDAESVKYEESTFNKFGEHGSDFSEVEKYATGKVTKGSKPKKFIREPDYAKGGLAGVLKL